MEPDRHIDLVGVEPLTGNCCADVGLTLMVPNNNIDRLAEHFTAGILNRHTRRDDRARSAKISVNARLVVEHTNSNEVVRYCALTVPL